MSYLDIINLILVLPMVFQGYHLLELAEDDVRAAEAEDQEAAAQEHVGEMRLLRMKLVEKVAAHYQELKSLERREELL